MLLYQIKAACNLIQQSKTARATQQEIDNHIIESPKKPFLSTHSQVNKNKISQLEFKKAEQNSRQF